MVWFNVRVMMVSFLVHQTFIKHSDTFNDETRPQHNTKLHYNVVTLPALHSP